MRLFPAIFLFVLLSAGCDKPETIPAYLRVEPFQLNVPGGSTAHEVPYGWVYVNNDLLGGFELPVELPVLTDGEKEVVVLPGINGNGLSSTPTFYPLLDRFVQKIDFVSEEKKTITPSVAYLSSLKFAWPEELTTFDGPSSIDFLDRDGDLATNYKVMSGEGFAGKGIVMEMNKDHSLMEIASGLVPLPNDGAVNVWLELHHQNDAPFSMQIIGVRNDGFEEAIPLYLFNPTEAGEWNKIYINITNYLPDLKRPNYRVFFRAALPQDASGVVTAQTATVKLDNIRLLHL